MGARKKPVVEAEALKEKLKQIKKRKSKQKEAEPDGPVVVISLEEEAEDTSEEAQKEPTLEAKAESSAHDNTGAESEIFEMLNGIDKRGRYRFESNRHYFTICIYLFFLVAAAGLVIYAITRISAITDAIKGFLGVLTPFFGGLLIAFLLNPLVKRIDTGILEKLLHIKSRGIRKAIAMLLSYAFVIGLLVLVLGYVLPQIGTSLNDLYSRRDLIFAAALELMDKLQEQFPQIDVAFVEAKLMESLTGLLTKIPDIVTNVVPKILSISVSIAMTVFNFFLAIAISIYVIADKRNLTRMATRLTYAILPKKTAKGFSDTAKECADIFGGFVIGKSIDSLIIGVLCFIVLSIVQLPYAVLVSVLVGITNMIPYFGPFIGAVPGALLYLCIRPVDALLFCIIILILQQLDGWVLGPAILGESTGLKPLWVIFAITVGGAYAGVLGMFLGVPVVAVISYLADRIVSAQLQKKKLEIK